ncbi:UNVERIFIED_CONTAM: hypothetical protein Sindi_0380600, partial [Sesamum indicum]
ELQKNLSGGNHCSPNQRPDHINLDRKQDQQRLHSKDLDEQMQDLQGKPLREELSKKPIPEPIKVSRTATDLPAEKGSYI